MSYDIAIDRLIAAGEEAHALRVAKAHADAVHWVADDGNAAVAFDYVDTAAEAAHEYVSDGDWGDDRSETSWVTVYTWPRYVVGDTYVDDRDDRASHTVEIEAEVPECTDGGDHDWQAPYELVGGIEDNPGCWGKGAGVVCEEVCMRCGCARSTDTWAQNRETGEQGLTAVSYEPGKYAGDIVPPEVSAAAAELRSIPAARDELGCGGIVEAAAYVLLAARGEHCTTVDSPLSAIPREHRAQIDEVTEALRRAYRHGIDERGMRLLIWIAACHVDTSEAYSIAHAVRAAL